MLWNSASPSWKMRGAPIRVTGCSDSARSRICCGVRERAGDADLRRPPQARHRLLFQVGLVDQAVAHVGVVIGPKERLLEPPVLQVRGRGLPLQRLELLRV